MSLPFPPSLPMPSSSSSSASTRKRRKWDITDLTVDVPSKPPPKSKPRLTSTNTQNSSNDIHTDSATTFSSPSSSSSSSSSGLPKPLWLTPEFIIYYILALPSLYTMFSIPIRISLPTHPLYPTHAHRLSPGWIRPLIRSIPLGIGKMVDGWVKGGLGEKVDNSDMQYRGFRDNMVLLGLFVGVFWVGKGVLRRVGMRDGSEVGRNLVMAVISLFLLHGASAAKVLLLCSVSWCIARTPWENLCAALDARLRRATGLSVGRRRYAWIRPIMLWSYNLFVLWANDRWDGYRYASIFGDGWGWLDEWKGVYPRWDVSFNITMLRLVSFGMDYHWSLQTRGQGQAHPSNPSTNDTGTSCPYTPAHAPLPSNPNPPTPSPPRPPLSSHPPTPTLTPSSHANSTPPYDPPHSLPPSHSPSSHSPSASLSKPPSLSSKPPSFSSTPHPPSTYTLPASLAYALYTPLYIAGPVMGFNDWMWQGKIIDKQLRSARGQSGGVEVGDMQMQMHLRGRGGGSGSCLEGDRGEGEEAGNGGVYIPRRPYPMQKLAPYAIRFVVNLLVMEVMLHTMHVVAIKDSKPWRHTYSPSGVPYTTSPTTTTSSTLSPPLPFPLSLIHIFSFSFPTHIASYTLPQWSLIAFHNLLLVWLKLLIPWRFFRLFALLDGVDPPENMVRCMANNYEVGGFWRGWHRGFNLWIVRYIYIPLSGSNHAFLNTLVVFTFVALWHDISFKLLMWGWIAGVIIGPEMLVKAAFGRGGRARRLIPPRLLTPLTALAAVLNLLLLMLANLIGFVLGVDGVSAIWTGLVDARKQGSSVGRETVTLLLISIGILYIGVRFMFEYREAERRRGIYRGC